MSSFSHYRGQANSSSTKIHSVPSERKSIQSNRRYDQTRQEHPINEPAPWVSSAVIDPKLDGSIRMTLDARHVNKAILPMNHPIPRHDDIKAKLAQCKISKMNRKSADWQIEVDELSRYLTVFHAIDKLFRYKKLTMGLKPSQGELNVGLKPIFAHMSNAHLIHGDIIIATKNKFDHIKAVTKAMEAVNLSGVTLNPDKYHFGCKEIKFWGMTYSAPRMKPEPAKVDGLKYISPPSSNKDDFIRFLCMI